MRLPVDTGNGKGLSRVNTVPADAFEDTNPIEQIEYTILKAAEGNVVSVISQAINQSAEFFGTSGIDIVGRGHGQSCQ